MRKFHLYVGMLLLLLTQMAYAQRTVTGKVVSSADQAPIGGVTVHVKGSKTNAVTANDGTFSLTTAEANPVLELSSIGYLNKSVAAVNGATIALDVDARSLSEIVVTGVGVATSKKKLAIAVESINTDKTTPVPSASVDQFLVGKVAGAQIQSVSGSPGAQAQILLRGINTLRRGTAPMILLDGIEVGATDLNSLDLNNIERVEVIQGAASATIYGAQGANGVIQLFTKRGKQGKTNIDVSSSVSANDLLNIGDLHKARFHSLKTDANNVVIGSGGTPLEFDPQYESYLQNVVWNSLDPTNNNNKAYDKNLQYYDHYKMFFRTAYTTTNSISISGGREKVDFNITASDNRQNSNFKDNGWYSRSNLSANIGMELFKNFRFRSITQLAYTRNTQRDQTGRTIIYALNNSRPFANYDYKNEQGLYGAYFGDAVGVNGYNPNYVNQYSSFTDNKIDIIQNFGASYRFPKFVDLDARYGINYQTQEQINNIFDQSNNDNADYWQLWLEYYYPRTSYGAPGKRDETGEINHFRYNTLFQNFIGTATVRTDFRNDFHLRIPLRTITQFTYDVRKSKFNQYITYGLNAPNYSPYTADQMAEFKIASDFTVPFLTYGFLVNQKFEWGDIAGISGGVRRDYSSAFGKGQTPKNFPRGDAYVRLSGFNFWNNSGLARTISEFKLRAAYGEAGIQPFQFDRYPTVGTRSVGSRSVFVLPLSNPNPNLDVEVSKELELGTDLSFNVLKGSFLKNLNLSFTYWDRKTVNAIFDVDLAPSAGTGTIKDNAYGIGSHGVQASLNMTVLNSRNLNWNLTTLFSKQTSKITSVIGQEVVVTSNAGSSNYVLRAGEKIGQLYGYLMLHSVDATDAQGNYYIPKDQQSNYVLASNGWVVDKNTKQPYVTPGQYTFGDPNPKFNMSFINDLSFKGLLSFSMQWDWVNGNHLYNQTKEWMYRDGIHGDYDKPITVNGETGAWTAFYRGVYAQVSRNGTKNYFYEDASFWRLRNISLAFDVARWKHIPYFQRLQLVLSARNLATITKYTGMDPEISSGTTNSAFDRGVDHNTVPNIRSLQVGLNIGF